MNETTWHLHNRVTGTQPGLAHWNGKSTYLLEEVKAHVLARLTAPVPLDDLTVLTWNSRPDPGLLERSLECLGASCQVLGRNVRGGWPKIKIRLTREFLDTVRTRFVLAADSWDALLLASPMELLRRFREDFDCQLLFGTEKFSWPLAGFLTSFEDDVGRGPFRYLNSGAWIGETSCCRDFFHACERADPEAILAAIPRTRRELASRDDQGITRQVFQRYFPAVRLDQECRLFQSLFQVGPDEVCWEQRSTTGENQ